MNLPDGLLPAAWLYGAHAVFALLFLHACWRAPWHILFDDDRAHAFLGVCVALMVLWSIKAGVQPGLNFHLLGATALTLMVGPALALVGLTGVLVGNTLIHASGVEAFSANALVMAAVPVAVSEGLQRALRGFAPRHFFVFVFGAAFAGGALALASVGITASAIFAAARVYPADELIGQYLPYFLLLAFPEAILTGSSIALMVVYRPRWVLSFDDALYLGR